MRLLALFAVLCSFGLFASQVRAADEFGPRFSVSAPPALEGFDAALSDITPAAGDEDLDEETQIDNEADDAQPEDQDD